MLHPLNYHYKCTDLAFVPFFLETFSPYAHFPCMEKKLDTFENPPTSKARLPNWMFWGAVIIGATLATMLIFAIADGEQTTPVEDSPFRNAPEEVLSPNE